MADLRGFFVMLVRVISWLRLFKPGGKFRTTKKHEHKTKPTRTYPVLEV